MALFVVATPIGNPGDFTQRGLEALRSADLIIGEELKPLRQILKAAGVQAPAMDQLNEHSRPADIEHFLGECRVKNVALVSDCGTPGFCDPGADLVAACHKAGVAVHGLPGASSLMALLSVSGVRVDQFVFFGFLPAKAELREAALRELVREKRAVIVMETPYRAARLAADLAQYFGERFCVLGLNLTQEKERVVRARGRDLAQYGPYEDAEPVVLILPAGSTSF
jgi:16S rRNA (cytidine1402-2'-O)-methyltransferase